MGGLIPLGDASRRPVRVPIVTILIILVNAFVFVREWMGGEAFVMQWSAIPDQVVSGHRFVTILTAMFMHASWSHIIGNMIFLWAFGPEIEDAMGRWRYSVFYLVGGMVAMLAQVAASPHSTVPNLGASGAIAAVMGAFLVVSSRPDSVHSAHLYICEGHIHSGGAVDRLLVPHAALQCRPGRARADWRSRLPGARRRVYFWGCHGSAV